jgi:hypothetical protein
MVDPLRLEQQPFSPRMAAEAVDEDQSRTLDRTVHQQSITILPAHHRMLEVPDGHGCDYIRRWVEAGRCVSSTRYDFESASGDYCFDRSRTVAADGRRKVRGGAASACNRPVSARQSSEFRERQAIFNSACGWVPRKILMLA